MVALRHNKRVFRSDGIALIPEAEFTPDQQLKTGSFVIARIQYHVECGEMNPKAACKAVAVELSADWVKKGVVRKSLSAVADQLAKNYAEMKRLQKYDLSRSSSKTPSDLNERLSNFKSRMSNGYDIQSSDKGRIAAVEQEMGRKMGEADFLFYEDNCRGDRRITLAPDKTQTRRVCISMLSAACCCHVIFCYFIVSQQRRSFAKTEAKRGGLAGAPA